MAKTDRLRRSFFPQTIRLLNIILDYITILAVLTLVDARMNLRVPNFFDWYVIGSIPDYRTNDTVIDTGVVLSPYTSMLMTN